MHSFVVFLREDLGAPEHTTSRPSRSLGVSKLEDSSSFNLPALFSIFRRVRYPRVHHGVLEQPPRLFMPLARASRKHAAGSSDVVMPGAIDLERTVFALPPNGRVHMCGLRAALLCVLSYWICVWVRESSCSFAAHALKLTRKPGACMWLIAW